MTLKEIDDIANDYEKRGIRDPTYLNNLQQLRYDFLKKAEPSGYYVRPVR